MTINRLKSGEGGELDNSNNKITELSLRRAIATAFVILVFVDVFFALPELIRPTFSLGYERAALNLTIGFAAGGAIAGVLTTLLQNRLGSSLIIPVRSWHLTVGFWLVLLTCAEVSAQMAQKCLSLSLSETTECFTNIIALNRMRDGLLFGILAWCFLWTLVRERSCKGQLVLAVHSKTQWTIQGWSVTYLLMTIGFGFFLLYVFYQIFNLK